MYSRSLLPHHCIDPLKAMKTLSSVSLNLYSLDLLNSLGFSLINYSSLADYCPRYTLNCSTNRILKRWRKSSSEN